MLHRFDAPKPRQTNHSDVCALWSCQTRDHVPPNADHHHQTTLSGTVLRRRGLCRLSQCQGRNQLSLAQCLSLQMPDLPKHLTRSQTGKSRNQYPKVRLAPLRTEYVCLICVFRSAPSKQGLRISGFLVQFLLAAQSSPCDQLLPCPNHGAMCCGAAAGDQHAPQALQDRPGPRREWHGDRLCLHKLGQCHGLLFRFLPR